MKVKHGAAAVMLVLASACLSTVVLAQADAGVAPAKNTAPTLPALREAAGKIDAIDGEHNVITVDGKRLQVDQTTTIFVSGRTGTMEDLDEGVRVRATYEPGADRPVAQWIELVPK
jgi:hypothetical protein